MKKTDKKLLITSIEATCQSLINKTRYGQELNGVDDLINDNKRIIKAVKSIMITIKLIESYQY